MLNLSSVKSWSLEKLNSEISAATNTDCNLECIDEARKLFIEISVDLENIKIDLDSNEVIELLDSCSFAKTQDWEKGRTVYFITDEFAIFIAGNDVSLVGC